MYTHTFIYYSNMCIYDADVIGYACTATCKIVETRFQRFSSSKLVHKTVETVKMSLNQYNYVCMYVCMPTALWTLCINICVYGYISIYDVCLYIYIYIYICTHTYT